MACCWHFGVESGTYVVAGCCEVEDGEAARGERGMVVGGAALAAVAAAVVAAAVPCCRLHRGGLVRWALMLRRFGSSGAHD